MSGGAKNKRRSRRHHQVPKFYLRGFADEREQIMRVELPGEKRHPIGINHATVERDFYTAELADGSTTDAVEVAFASIEAQAAPALRAVIAGEWPIEGQTRGAVAMWAGLQFLRTSAIRQQSTGMRDTMLKLHIAATGKRGAIQGFTERNGRPPTEEELDDLWQRATDFDSWAVTPRPNDHLRLIADMFADTAKRMATRGWFVIHFERCCLLTGDEPVFLALHPDEDQTVGVGLLTAALIGVPLDRRTALLMAAPGAHDMRVDPSRAFATFMNTHVILNARSTLYHHPGDDPLATFPTLPGPRTRELGNNGRPLMDALVAKHNAGLPLFLPSADK